MALPKIKDSKVSTIKLSGREVRIRPFVGTEEKIILTSKLVGDENKKSFMNSVLDVASNCSGIDARELTLGEVEMIFMEIRKISVSDIIDFSYHCPHCSKAHSIKIKMKDLEIPKSFVDELTLDVGTTDSGEEVKIFLRTPKAGDVVDIESGSEDSELRLVFACLEGIYVGKETVPTPEFEDFKEWFLGLTNVYAKAVAFSISNPTVSFERKFPCIECKEEVHLRLRGAKDFLKR